MDINKLKTSSIIIANTLTEINKEIADYELDKGLDFANYHLIDAIVEANEIICLCCELLNKSA